MKIEVQKVGDTIVVALEGRLDTTNYNELEEQLSGLMEKDEKKILLDIGSLDYISSSGLRILLMYLKKLRAAQGSFMLCGMKPEIREIFEISGFINIFKIYSDRQSALEK